MMLTRDIVFSFMDSMENCLAMLLIDQSTPSNFVSPVFVFLALVRLS